MRAPQIDRTANSRERRAEFLVCVLFPLKELHMALSEQLAPHLPYLRRYARAVTGSQANGDACVRATLTALLSGQSELVSYLPPRVALYRLFHEIWARSLPGHPEMRPSTMTASGRPALLLSALEGFSITEISQILQEAAEDVD